MKREEHESSSEIPEQKQLNNLRLSKVENILSVVAAYYGVYVETIKISKRKCSNKP